MMNDDYSKRRKAFSVISIAVLVLFLAGGTALLWKPVMENFREPELFRAWVNEGGDRAKIAFVGVVILQVVFAIIPGEPIEFAAGYAFGAIEGALLCLIGMALGSILIYWFVRVLGMKLVEVFISRERIASLKYIRESRNLNTLVFTIFLIPGTPKDLITYVIGLTPMRAGTFLMISTIARIPSVITSTIAGGALGVSKVWTAAIIYTATGILSVAGLIIYRKKTGNKH